MKIRRCERCCEGGARQPQHLRLPSPLRRPLLRPRPLRLWERRQTDHRHRRPLPLVVVVVAAARAPHIHFWTLASRKKARVAVSRRWGRRQWSDPHSLALCDRYVLLLPHLR